MFLRSEKQVRHEKFISDSFRHFEKAVCLKKNFCQNNAECFEKNRDALIKSMNAWCEAVLQNNQESDEVIFVFYFLYTYTVLASQPLKSKRAKQRHIVITV